MTDPTPRRPPLRFADLSVGRTFGPSWYDVTPDVVERYADITGDADPIHRDPRAARDAGYEGPVAPPGLLGLVARLAYLPEHRMLPGGVMAGQTFELIAEALVGDRLELTATVTAIDPSDGRRKVVIRSDVTSPRGLVAAVTIDARWPPDEVDT